jgi:hypothetical protein
MIWPAQPILWAIFGLVVAMVAVAAGRRDGGRRASGLVVGILVAVGLVVWFPTAIRSNRSADRSAAERTNVRAPRARAVVEAARAATSQAAAEARQAAHDVKTSVGTELAEMRELGRGLKETLRAGVQVDGQKLVISAHAELPEVPPLPPVASAPGVPDEEDSADLEAAADESEADSEELLTAAAREDMTVQLTQYFDELADEPSGGKTPELVRLGVTLAALPPEQRRAVAAEVAQLDGVVDVDQTVTTGDEQNGRVTHRVLVAQVDPRRIERIVKTGRFRQRSDRGPQFDGKIVILGTIGVLVVATLILKAATRRHTVRA